MMALALLRQRGGAIAIGGSGGSGSRRRAATTTTNSSPPHHHQSSDIDAALELFSPPGDARPKWRLAQEGPCGRGLFAASPLPRGAAALRLPASGLLAVPLPQEGTPPTDGAPLELYERYLDAWERGNGGRALPSELRRLLLRPLVLADADDADDDDDEEANKNKTQEPVGPAARLAAFLLWAVVGSGGGGEGGEGDDDQQQQQRWRRYASAVLPRPPPSLVGAPLPSSSARPWLPDPQSMLLDAHPGELEAAASAGAGDLADKALRMRAQAASAAAAARRTLRGCGEEGQQQQEEAESWWWWWWALDMAKSRAFALAAPTSGGGGGGGTLRLAVLAPVADLLNHDDDENGVGGAACACRLDGDGDGDGPLFSLVVAARRDVREGEELTLDYTSESGLDSAALAAGYRFVPAGGCVGDRLPRHRAAAALLALSLPSPPPGRLTPELRRGLARAADALAEDAAARPAVRRRAHRALASLVEAAAGRGGGEGGGGAAEAEAEAVAAAAAAAAARAGQQELSPAVAAFLRERALLEEAAREVVARLVE